MGEARAFRRPVSPRVQLAVILLVFVALGLTYALRTPAFEAPDEASHFLYIHNLIETGELPLLEDHDTVFASQSVQRHHPPLYYLLGAALVAGTDRSNVSELLQTNPFASVGTVSAVNQNAFLHPLLLSGSGALTAVLLLRLAGIAFGVGTVWLVYRTGRALGGTSVGLASAWLVACLPGFLFVSASINNDTLVIFFSSAGITLLAEAWAVRRLSLASGIVLGLILGGIALTKVNGLAVFGVVGAWAVMAVWNGRMPWRALLRPLLAAAVLAVVVASWWYIRNLMLYGDPLALAATLRIWGRGAAGPSWNEAVGVWDSFWMVLGQFNVRGPDWFYRLYAPMLVIAGVGLALWAAYRRRLDRALTVWLLVAVLAALAALAVATRSVNVSQGRILYPALAAFAPLLIVGARRLLPWQVTAAALAPLMLFAVAAPLLYLDPAYPAPNTIEAVSADAVIIGSETDGLRLEALHWPSVPVRTGDTLDLTLYLSGANTRNPYLTLRAVDPNSQGVLGSVNVYPGMLPTDSTESAGLLAVPLRLPIEGSVDQPEQMQLLLGWEAPAEGEGSPALRLPIVINGQTVDTVRLAGPVLVPKQMSVASAQHRLDTLFGDAIRLDGYSLETTDDGLNLTLNITPLSRMNRDYTLTVGVMSADGQAIAQADGPVAGYPTSAWLAGFTFAESRALSLPESLPAGASLFVGWYALEDGARLPVQGGDAQDNLLFLPTVDAP
ncbi:MAG TPA: glycosyltransferase family 39 protein [Candidatus Limnocylindrales bacterium]|nr:glycosyltransferase family 39 protein [Candidatus Limnocylindrales bacterium]